MEASLVTLDVLFMTWICWKVFKLDAKTPADKALGFLSYKTTDSETGKTP